MDGERTGSENTVLSVLIITRKQKNIMGNNDTCMLHVTYDSIQSMPFFLQF